MADLPPDYPELKPYADTYDRAHAFECYAEQAVEWIEDAVKREDALRALCAEMATLLKSQLGACPLAHVVSPASHVTCKWCGPTLALLARFRAMEGL